MKRPMFLLLTAALFTAMTALSAHAQIKYVAVVETELDEQSGAASKLSKAEVRQITAELRNVAVKNLPWDRYNIMTSETVMAQGGAKLEECAEENCVISLGSIIGADYIVRGIVSKLGTSLTLSVEMYETVDGNLVATSGLIRSGNTAELVDKAAWACAEMYKMFVNGRNRPITYTITVAANPDDGGYVSCTPNQVYYAQGTIVSVTAAPANGYAFVGWSGSSSSKKAVLTAPIDRNLALTANFQDTQHIAKETSAWQTAGSGGDYETALEREPMTGFSVGSGFSPGVFQKDGGHWAIQLGCVHSRPMLENVLSLNIEGNIWIGEAYYSRDSDYGDAFGIFGFNVPATVLLRWKFFSVEAGLDGDMLFGDGDVLFNAGFVVGAGVGFSKNRSRRYFYRYCGGYNYVTHVVGMWWLF